MDELRDDAEYAVFDDISGGFKFFPNYKRLAGLPSRNLPSPINTARKKRFKWKPCIMLMNSNPADDMHVDYEWLEGNCEIIFISADNPLVSNVHANTP